MLQIADFSADLLQIGYLQYPDKIPLVLVI